MRHIKVAQEIAVLYPMIYQRLHARRQKEEQRLSSETMAMLVHLELSGPLTVTEAARHFQRAQSAMSELIDRLQAHGHVERIRDTRDWRRTLVWMTATGIDSLRRSRQVLDGDLLTRCMQRMSTRDRRYLVAGLRALVCVQSSVPTQT